MPHIQKRSLISLAVCASIASACQNTASPAGQAYYPGYGQDWEVRDPAALGMDAAFLNEAINYANAHETALSRDAGTWLRERFAGIPHQDIVGPTKPRGDVNGIVLRNGYIVAEWGDTRRVDMNFSVTKSYLSTVAGLAYDDGLIESLDDPLHMYVQDGTFDAPNNNRILWKHLLQQTSEWEGELFGKPDIADRREGIDRAINEPGTFWEYNDIRVNLLAYSLLHVWRRSLPTVLRDRIMEPIGASTTWRWHGYETSWTYMDGVRVQSVSGGGHWGGGLWASTRDHARFGYLFLRNGEWRGQQILSEDWIKQATTPVDIQPNYGYMWWLNTNQTQFSAAPASSFFALGAGSTNVIWVDPEHDIVAVTRWIDGTEHVNEFIRLVIESLGEG